MVRELCKDVFFLAQKSEAAGPEDLPAVRDLLDTLEAHRERCVGMAANMIGIRRRIIVFFCDGAAMAMLNPRIVRKSEPYQTEEGCLSLPGTRPVQRWKTIKVQYQNEAFQMRLKTFTGWTAEIIQHEIDHCDGILI